MGAFVLLAFLVAAVSLASYTWGRFQEYRDVRRLLEEFSAKYGGALRPGDPFPSVYFRRQGLQALLTLAASKGEPGLYVQFTFFYSLPAFKNRLDVFPERQTHSLNRYFGTEDVQIGDPRFDPLYLIRADNPSFAREYLTGEVKRSIQWLRQCLATDQIYLSINPSRMIVKKLVPRLQSFLVLEEIARESFRLLEALVAGGAAEVGPGKAIEFKAEGAVPPEEAVCQVCGTAIQGLRVVCRACRTPHHKECWEYNERCSTYACGSRRYVEVGAGAPATAAAPAGKAPARGRDEPPPQKGPPAGGGLQLRS